MVKHIQGVKRERFRQEAEAFLKAHPRYDTCWVFAHPHYPPDRVEASGRRGPPLTKTRAKYERTEMPFTDEMIEQARQIWGDKLIEMDVSEELAFIWSRHGADPPYESVWDLQALLAYTAKEICSTDDADEDVPPTEG